MEEKVQKCLFDIAKDEFIQSILGITNGKEDLESDPHTIDSDNEEDEQPQQHGQLNEAQLKENSDLKDNLVNFEGGEGMDNADGETVKQAETGKEQVKEMGKLSIEEGLTCRSCGVTFTSVEEQREHFKLDWHRCNVKRKVAKKAPLTETQFEKMMEEAELSSISGSDSEEEEDSSMLLNVKAPLIEFHLNHHMGKYATIWKTLLIKNPRENATVEEVINRVPQLFQSQFKWVILMCSGGHFAGVCFDKSKVVVHKTIHRYTVRRKQGGSQAAKDATGKKPKSAGASIRRYNEAMLQQEIRELLVEWGTHLKEAQFIFVQAPSLNKQIFFGYEGSPFIKGDQRLRKIPFSTRRPTFSEVKRIHGLLSTVFFSSESMYQKGPLSVESNAPKKPTQKKETEGKKGK